MKETQSPLGESAQLKRLRLAPLWTTAPWTSKAPGTSVQSVNRYRLSARRQRPAVVHPCGPEIRRPSCLMPRIKQDVQPLPQRLRDQYHLSNRCLLA